MLRTTIDINVDFYDKKYILINAKQNDKNSRFLSVTCYNHGVLCPINSGEHSAYIRYKKADEHSVFNFCEIDRYGKIVVELTEQMLAVDGICYADLVIVNKGSANVDADTGKITIEDSGILSTMTFCIDVSETAVENSDLESKYEFKLLNTKLEEYWADYEEVVQTARSWAIGNTGIRDGEDTDNAKYYAQQSSNSANSAKSSATSASASASKAREYEAGALESEQNAQTYMNNTKTYMGNAKASEESAFVSAVNAATSESNASKSEAAAQNSKESAANSANDANASATEAKGYLQQTEAITNGLNGAFLPKGTITFAELIELKNSGAVGAGDLYQISDDFTTDDNFRMSGKVCGAGTSVYYTVDDKFDVFVGATVAGVKGENETVYRTGMVNITPENVGAIPSADIATVDEIKNYLGI